MALAAREKPPLAAAVSIAPRVAMGWIEPEPEPEPEELVDGEFVEDEIALAEAGEGA